MSYNEKKIRTGQSAQIKKPDAAMTIFCSLAIERSCIGLYKLAHELGESI
jgi:hypothetical protein